MYLTRVPGLINVQLSLPSRPRAPGSNALPRDQQVALEPWRLELLEIQISHEDKAVEDRAQDAIEKLELLAAKYPEVAELQAQSAVEFAGFGRWEALDETMGRLKRLLNALRKWRIGSISSWLTLGLPC